MAIRLLEENSPRQRSAEAFKCLCTWFTISEYASWCFWLDNVMPCIDNPPPPPHLIRSQVKGEQFANNFDGRQFAINLRQCEQQTKGQLVFLEQRYKRCWTRWSRWTRTVKGPYDLVFHAKLSHPNHGNQGHPTTVFCKISVRRSKNCLEFSIPWGELIISLRFSEVQVFAFRSPD